MVDSISPWVSRPHHAPPVDPADNVALRIVVQAVLATLATQIEAVGGPPPQQWLNHISACCQEAVAASTISDGLDGAAFRARVVDQLNALLGGVHFPDAAPLDS